MAFKHRIDTDFKSLVLIDPSPMGDGFLDLSLAWIAESKDAADAEFWLREVSKNGEALLEHTLADLLADLEGVLSFNLHQHASRTNDALKARKSRKPGARTRLSAGLWNV